MPPPSRSPGGFPLAPLVLIAGIVAASAAAFAYTAGWLSPQRLTPNNLVAAFAPPGGPALGHRRNHVKGICFAGVFEANGTGAALSKAPMFVAGQYPVIGRFNLGTANIKDPDSSVRVRGMGLQITASNGQDWRMALINAPVFLVSTPQEFYNLLLAAASRDPNAMKDFIAANPEFGAFGAWAQSGPWTASYAEDAYNSLNSFVFTNTAGESHAVRWSLLPAAHPEVLSAVDLAKEAPDFLERDIIQRIKSGPLQWSMVVTVASPGDPTSDPSKAWPPDRRKINVGTLSVQRIEAEPDGPCRDINYDPTVLPPGMSTSDDPFPAARSSAYRRSYDLRTAESKYYPHTDSDTTP